MFLENFRNVMVRNRLEFAALAPKHTPESGIAVQVGPTASEVAESRRAQPTPPVAAAAVNNTDAPVAQPALKPVKDAKALPPRKRTKTDTSVSEKEPRQKSAEALARAALANVDANRPAPADTLIGPGLTDARSAPVVPRPPMPVGTASPEIREFRN
jgi:hypothetical protein